MSVMVIVITALGVWNVLLSCDTKICPPVDFNKLKDFKDFDRAAVFDVIFALRQYSYF